MTKIMKKEEFSILYIETGVVGDLDILYALNGIGYKVYKAAANISLDGYDKDSCQKIIDKIKEYKIWGAITYDFSESIAQACFETGIPYISWIFDSPLKNLYTHYAFYPCNYIFVFDRKQKERLRQIGIKNVYYMPLAVMPNKVNSMSNETEKADIVFAGRLYKRSGNEFLMQNGEERIVKSIEKNIEECLLCWDKNVSIYGKMEEECVEYCNWINKEKMWKKYPYITEQFCYEWAVTGKLIANRERIIILNTLAEKYDMRFYTDCEETEELSPKVKIMPPLGYNEISKVYRNSKININITLHSIETGVPLRVFDVMAAGGFMLSNYQEELEELFVPGEDIVLYHNLKELEEKVEYYLTHEEERERIARNGHKKVMAYHNMHDRMRTIMEFVIKKELIREKSYSVLQKEGFYEQINVLLAEGKDDSYDKLFLLFESLQYAEDVPKAEEVSWFHGMLKCWKIEKKNGTSNIFFNVKNLKEAEYKYFNILHGVWRVESGLSEDKCREAIYKICENRESMLLLIWIIENHVQDKERVCFAISEYMQEYSIMDAVQFLYYGVKSFPQSKKLVQRYTEYFHILKESMEGVEHE